MAKVLHFLSEQGGEVSTHIRGKTVEVSEYIVITEDEDTRPEEWARKGFKFADSCEIEDTGSLPTETILLPD